tara:strand:+ start:4180 stop:4623 length:444 start_codon:yes stop_codon:yes gene_type:complete
LILSLLVGVALGVPPLPERPAPPDRVPGECDTNYPISLGRSLPDGLATPSVLANCSAVAVPLSEYADLLGTERWSIAIEKRYKLDTFVLKNERDWYKNRLEEELLPKSFVERPSTQRWLGRIEMIVVVGIVTAGLGTTYYYGSGGLK